MEAPYLIVDLCELNKNHSNKFAVFWEKVKVFLNESSAVQKRQHDEFIYVAKSNSIKYLIQE